MKDQPRPVKQQDTPAPMEPVTGLASLRGVPPPIRYRRDEEGKRRKIVMWEGREGYELTVTTSCSGCCELGEYGSNPNGHGFDVKHNCYVGSGCDECGYTGKRRGPFWAPFLDQENEAHS